MNKSEACKLEMKGCVAVYLSPMGAAWIRRSCNILSQQGQFLLTSSKASLDRRVECSISQAPATPVHEEERQGKKEGKAREGKKEKRIEYGENGKMVLPHFDDRAKFSRSFCVVGKCQNRGGTTEGSQAESKTMESSWVQMSDTRK